jgi:glutathionylspermidine synthase
MYLPAGHLPYGAVQGEVDGVKAYSNGHDSHFEAERNIDGRIMTGFRWQCVEFSRRWLLERKGLLLPDIPTAALMFDMKHVDCVESGDPVDIVSVPNGTTEKPIKDTLLIFPVSDVSPYGHVAVITGVFDDHITIADQNQHFHKWEGNYSAKMPLRIEDGKYTVVNVHEAANPVGWMTFPSVQNRDVSIPLNWHEKFVLPVYPPMRLERVTMKPEEVAANWLDVNNAAEKKFVETFGMDLSRSRLNEVEANYYMGNFELMLSLIGAGSSLNKIFVDVTAKVLASDELLGLFDVPKEFWGRMRTSFEKQLNSLTGRFDFALDTENNLKSFEYNADSASTLLECGRIQQKYLESIGVANKGRVSGFRVERMLKTAWTHTGVKGTVHFLIDDDQEEEYTALYMLETAEATGLKGRLCKGFEEFRFNDDGKVVDGVGEVVTTVWKTWNWNTAMADYKDAKAARGEGWKPSKTDKVRLCDLVLGDESILVYEPLWKLIPANKAILPLVWDHAPNHPNLLPTSFKLTEGLKKTGYVEKPISGRIGMNVTIVDAEGAELGRSEGRFTEAVSIYQELLRLPKRDDYHAIFGGWIIGGEAAGIGIREDKTLITGEESPFSAMILVDDDQFKKE